MRSVIAALESDAKAVRGVRCRRVTCYITVSTTLLAQSQSSAVFPQENKLWLEFQLWPTISAQLIYGTQVPPTLTPLKGRRRFLDN